jgi:hypothetical protein
MMLHINLFIALKPIRAGDVVYLADVRWPTKQELNWQLWQGWIAALRQEART